MSYTSVANTGVVHFSGDYRCRTLRWRIQVSYTSVANTGVVHFSGGDHFRLHDLPAEPKELNYKTHLRFVAGIF